MKNITLYQGIQKEELLMTICKFCGVKLTDKDWAMPAKGKDQYACIECREKALKELNKQS